MRFNVLLSAVVLAGSSCGCSATRISDTPRTGIEQLLISKAIDDSLDKVDFSGLAGKAVYVDEKYLDCVDKKYIIGSIRLRSFQSGARLVDKPEDADLIVEVHSGGIGTDRSEGFLGIPAVNVPGPYPMQIPEIKVASQTTQYGTARIAIVAYDAKTKQALADGGTARARSINSNWLFFGVGPLNTGSIREEVTLAAGRSDSSADDRITLAPLRSEPFAGTLPETAKGLDAGHTFPNGFDPNVQAVAPTAPLSPGWPVPPTAQRDAATLPPLSR